MGGKEIISKTVTPFCKQYAIKIFPRYLKATLTFEKRKAGGPVSSGLIHGKEAEVA